MNSIIAPVLNAAQKTDLRALFTEASGLADTYDGSEAGIDGVLKPLIDAEKLMQAAAPDGRLTPDLEAEFTRQSGLPPETHTIGAILQSAQDHFLGRLQTAARPQDIFDLITAGGGAVVDSTLCFLPPDPAHHGIMPGDGGGVDKPRFEPRLKMLLAALLEAGVHMDDILVTRGAVAPGAMRLAPYMLVSIPRLAVEIAVCDQVGEATRVSRKILGPLVWALHTKQDLADIHGVVRVVGLPGWAAEAARLALGGPDIKTTQKIKPADHARRMNNVFPLTEELILDCALRHLEKYGALPTQHSEEPITGPDGWEIPGQSWMAWNQALRGTMKNGQLRPSRGLPAGSSLPLLFNRYKETKFYGLCDLTEDMIADCALRHLEKYGVLPSADSKESIIGPDGREIPGQSWKTWDQALRGQMYKGQLRPLRGLPRGSSLLRLFNRYKDTKFYGLCDLTEEMIIDCALRHLEKYGALPTDRTKEPIFGPDGREIPRQSWKAWDHALRGTMKNGQLRPSRGLPAGSSLPLLFNRYKETKFYGLCDLTEDMIADCALRHLEKYGVLPSADSKESIIGPDGREIPRQSWKAWNQALRGHMYKGELRSVRGLPGGSTLAKFYKTDMFQAKYENWRAARAPAPAAPDYAL